MLTGYLTAIGGGPRSRALSSGRLDDEVPVRVSRDPAREAAQRELSDPRYAEHEPSLWRRALDWVGDQIADLLDSAADRTPGGWVGLIALALVVLLLLAALRSRLGTPPPRRRTDGPLFEDRPRNAADHRAAAERHAAAQRWNEALQERVRAVVRALEERAVLDVRPGRTADEAAETAGQAFPDHVTALRAAARAFDEVTYAGRPADALTYTRVGELDTALGESRPRPVGSASPRRAV